MGTLQTYHATLPEDIDVAIIGAGINGLAIAREAAMRGLSTVIIERDDLGARTTSISTRLIHGGLKYLERLFDVRLVFESIHERNLLLKLAPHLVERYPMIILLEKGAKRPGWMITCGLILHDVLAVGKALPHNSVIFNRRLEREWPQLAETRLKWAGIFEDSHVPLTERLCVEIALAAADHGALFLTHSPVVGLLRNEERVTGVQYRDSQDGIVKSLPAKVVVNAAGPWVDSVLDLAGSHDRFIGATKGSHAVVADFPGAPRICIFFEAAADGRPMFVLPWEGKYMLGTTDIPFDGSLDEIVADDSEIDYLLKEVNRIIPVAKLTPDDVLWSYSGVRPLPYIADMKDPAKVTRNHQIIVHDGNLRGLVSVVGGKLTTHRALGDQAGAQLVKLLGKGDPSSPSRHSLFPGAPAQDAASFPERFVQGSSLPGDIAARLARIYGTRAEQVESLVKEHPKLVEVFDQETQAIAAELVFAVESEGAQTLSDVLLRRTAVALNSDVGLACAPTAARLLGSWLNWDEDRTERELQMYRLDTRRFRPRIYSEQH
jgi:glycerol-3-phosphate dehydrogenase